MAELDMDLKALGRSLKGLRLARGLEQKELGELTGVHQAQISRLERGLIERPSVPELNALAHFFGLTLSQLLGQAGPDPGDQPTLARLYAEYPDLPVALMAIAERKRPRDIEFLRMALSILNDPER